MPKKSKVHFVGIGGAGMSALAQFHQMGGGQATGSDRLLDRGEIPELRAPLERLGVGLFAQDGSGIDEATEALVLSTAIEDDNPELARAHELGIEIRHRTDVLAAHVAAHRTLAIAGTSGKSTVAAMIFEILIHAGRAPSIITGAPLVFLQAQGLYGNAFKDKSDLLVVEADESDGTLPKYRPHLGVLMNLGRDHKTIEELRVLFADFKKNSEKFLVCADHANLKEFHGDAETFGFDAGSVRAKQLNLAAKRTQFTVEGVRFDLPEPGRYNAENALAAIAAAQSLGVELKTSAEALRDYQGVARRFRVVGEKSGVVVVDDYAHNPDKVRAVIGAARLRAQRLRVVFQPHGFTPTRFNKDGFIRAFSESLSDGDILWMPDIYYAGGTAAKDISSEDLIAPIREAGRDARYIGDRAAIPADIAASVRRGDLVLVLGARDPSLSAFAAAALAALP